MSTAAVALIAAGVGAVLAGAMNLALAWRHETREAKAGRAVVIELLDTAQRRLDGAARADGWWADGTGPWTEPWQAYRGALADRLPRAVFSDLEKTMATLDALNVYSYAQRARADLYEVKTLEAMISSEQAEAPSAVAERVGNALEAVSPNLSIGEDGSLLRDAIQQANDTVERLQSVGAVRWHWRPAIAVAAAVALAVAILLATQSGESELSTQKVADIVASHVDGEALTSCEKVPNHDLTWNCILAFQQDGGVCSASAEAVPFSGSTLAQSSATPPPSCGGKVSKLQELLIRKQNKDNCVDAAMVEQTLPGNTTKPIPSRGPFIQPLPSKLTPGSAFTACE